MDQQYELCILGATRIRKILLFFGFCSLITWILFGTYGNYNSKDAILPPDTFKISRSLLGLAVNQQDELLEETFDPNGTNDNVEVSLSELYNRPTSATVIYLYHRYYVQYPWLYNNYISSMTVWFYL